MISTAARNSPSRWPVWIAVLLVVAVAACGGTSSPEDRLREVLASGEHHLESRDIDEVGALISADYSDDERRGRQELLGLLRGYFHLQGPVFLLAREESLEVVAPGKAEATLLVAVTTVELERLTELEGVTADVARVQLDFAEERGEWKLTQASWRPADLTELF